MSHTIVGVALLLCVFTFSLVRCDDQQGGLPLAPLPRFNCDPYEVLAKERVPTNVNRLAAHDIKVIMSLGDSITAAFGATGTPLGQEPVVPREDRYLSFTSGGGSMQYTINNFLKLYNPTITGSSSGSTLPLDALAPGGTHLEPLLTQAVGLNGALSGAVVQDLPQEIDYIVNELNTRYADSVDMQNDWKMATIFIGANNLCAVCHNNTRDTPESFGKMLNESLAKLHQEIPRLRVNLLPIFNLSQVYLWARSSSYCTEVWKLTEECSCLHMTNPSRSDRQMVNDAAVQYRKQLKDVEAYWKSKKLDTFAVTIQPFLDYFKIVNGALTSNFDCFHPSKLAHAWFGVGLWNSMWLPEGQKPTNTTKLLLEGVDFICPDRHTYIQ